DVVLQRGVAALAGVAIAAAARRVQQKLVPALEADIDELRRADGAVGLDKAAKPLLAAMPDKDAGRIAPLAAIESPGTLLHPIEQRAQSHGRCGDLEDAAAAQAAAELAGAAGIGPQRVFEHAQREAALEHLDRRGADR